MPNEHLRVIVTNSKRRVLVGVASLAACLGVANAQQTEQPTAHSNVKRTFNPSAQVTQVPARAGGLVIHLDANGKPTANPQRAKSNVRIPANNNSHAGLVEKKIKINGKDGGVTDLQGRFQSFSVATVGSDGTPQIGCVSAHDACTSTSGCKGGQK